MYTQGEVRFWSKNVKILHKAIQKKKLVVSGN